ncbi:unnamed protein product [Linum trigynum]|uniref:Uncharacterized protein n=1 Tax=Linum trigynum TaxID=586398 RepID=A0AAV2EWE7_9ROSI
MQFLLPESIRFDGGVRSDVPRHGGEKRDPVLRGGDGVGGGSIHHQSAELAGGLEIYVVNPDAGPADDLQPLLRRLENLLRDLGPAPHDQRDAGRDLPAQILRGEAVRTVHVAESAKEIQSGVLQFLGDEDGHFCL